jgi:hypothetical protein
MLDTVWYNVHMAQNTIIKRHDDLVNDLLNAERDENDAATLTYQLAEGEAIEQGFNTWPDKIIHAGPATVTIVEHRDGGVDVKVR